MYLLNSLMMTIAEGEAPPAETAEAPGMNYSFLIVIAGMFVIFYLFLIAPQRKQQKKHREMLGSLRKGDKVMTTGGMFGTVTNVHENELTLKVDEKNNIRARFSKSAIASVIEDKGSKLSDGDDEE